MPRSLHFSGLIIRIVTVAVLSSVVIAADPNDPSFAQQWALQNTGQVVEGLASTPGADTGIASAWETYRGARPIVVAVVGSGVEPHSEYAGRLLEGRAFVGDLFDTRDGCSVGTHVAGLIGAAIDNGVGIAGALDHVTLLPVRVFDGCLGNTASVASGIEWAVDQNVHVIVVAAKFENGSPELSAAVAYAASNDVLVIAPSGDLGIPEVSYPAAYSDCIAVSATDSQDSVTAFSNSGVEVELSAPGKAILSTSISDNFSTLSDAWWAPPAYVAGAAALLRSYSPSLSAVEIRQLLNASALDLGPAGPDSLYGNGRLNASALLTAAPAPPVRFEVIDLYPATIPPSQSSSFLIRIAEVADVAMPGTATLWWRIGVSPFSSVSLSSVGGDVYSAAMPAVSCESTIEYYFSVDTLGGALVTEPIAAPSQWHSVRAVNESVVFDDDFEIDRGWTTSSGGGAVGLWERVSPAGTSLNVATPVQPDFDFSPDAKTNCFVTGQHLGGSIGLTDVDGGPVQLVSPVVPVSSSDAEISYAVWFFTQSGIVDVLIVELSGDGGSSWTVVETVTSTTGWERHRFRLSDFPQVVGNQIRVRFTTSDGPPSDSLTEAAIDEFQVLAISCAAPQGDYNLDGRIDLTDYQEVSTCWSGPSVLFNPASCGVFDFDVDGDVDLIDAQQFQRLFDPM